MNRPIAEAFPVGVFVREEMEERGWTVENLAERCVLPVAEVQGIIDGTGPFLVRHSERLGLAFGTGGTVWLNLNLAYKKFLKSQQ